MTELIREADILELIGSNIRKLRLKKGISQKRLADICKREVAYLSRVEAGKINCTISTLKCICDGLRVNIADLLKADNQ